MIRCLGEIIDSVKRGEKPDYDELRYALLACVSLLNIEHRQLREELQREKPAAKFIRDMKLKNSFDAYKGAMQSSPKDWIGWDHDPDNQDYQKRYEIGNRMIDKFFGK